MKKRLLLTACLLSAGLAQAQIQKGNGILGGGINLSYSQQINSSYKRTDILPSVNLVYGQFVSKDWLIGANVQFDGQYNRISPEQINESRDQRNIGSINPFFRRYWAVGPVFLFAGAGISAGFDNTQADAPSGSATTGEVQTTSFSVNPTVEAGGTYFLSNRLALQGTVTGVGLPIPGSSINLGLVYWTGPTGTGKANLKTKLSTTQAGNWVLGGGFGSTGSKRTISGPGDIREAKGNTLYMDVSIGRFIAKSTLFGIGLGFSTNTQTQMPSVGSSTTQTYSIAPYAQHYLSNRCLTPFLRGTVLYASNRVTSSDQRVNTVQGSVGLGLAYLISNRFIVETSLATASYQVINFDENNRVQGANLSAQLGSGFSLRYVIAGRK